MFDQVIWPGPGQPLFDDAESAARSFVEEFVGLDDPPLGRSGRPGRTSARSTSTGEPNRERCSTQSSARSAVQRFDGNWFVTGAVAGDVQIESPAPDAEVVSPVRVEGRGRGFEGTVVVEVRDAFQPAGGNLGQDIGIAGCCEELVPFNALVPFTAPAADRGVIVARTDTGLDQGMVDFTAIPVRFGTAPSETGEVTTLRIFLTEFVDGTPGRLVEVERTVPRTTGVLRASLVALLDGPTDEEAARGLGSWFAADAGGAVEDVNLSEGRATVRLSSRLAESLPAPPGDAVIAELNATVFQFANVDVVRYELDGSCEAFDAWLGRGCEFTRDGIGASCLRLPRRRARRGRGAAGRGRRRPPAVADLGRRRRRCLYLRWGRSRRRARRREHVPGDRAGHRTDSARHGHAAGADRRRRRVGRHRHRSGVRTGPGKRLAVACSILAVDAAPIGRGGPSRRGQ